MSLDKIQPPPHVTISLYLSSAISLQDTVERLTAPVTACIHEPGEYSIALQTLWAAILHAAKLHSISSPGQSALVALLRGVKTLPGSPSLGDPTEEWASLPCFQETVREHYVRVWQDDGDIVREEWTNLNSFLSQISKERIVVGLESLGIEFVKLALEVRQEDERRLDVLLAGAGVWMVITAENIWDYLLHSSMDESQKADVYEKWQFWKDRFLFMSHRSDLSVSSRELAAEAEAVMKHAA